MEGRDGEKDTGNDIKSGLRQTSTKTRHKKNLKGTLQFYLKNLRIL
jgi:hypothetical protein